MLAGRLRGLGLSAAFIALPHSGVAAAAATGPDLQLRLGAYAMGGNNARADEDELIWSLEAVYHTASRSGDWRHHDLAGRARAWLRPSESGFMMGAGLGLMEVWVGSANHTQVVVPVSLQWRFGASEGKPARVCLLLSEEWRHATDEATDVAESYGLHALDVSAIVLGPRQFLQLNVMAGVHVEHYDRLVTAGPHLGLGNSLFPNQLQYHVGYENGRVTHAVRLAITIGF